MNPIPTAPLGDSPLHVPILGLGMAPLGGLYQDTSDAEATATVRCSLEHGARLFDTAPLYGRGLSERRLGQALAGIPRESYVLATKVGYMPDPEQETMAFDASRESILRCLETSLGRLGIGRVDILHIHEPPENPRAALEEAFPTLAELREQGVVRAIGAGWNRWEELADVLPHTDFDCFLLAGRYTLLEQGARPFLDLCRQKRIGVLLGGVYNSGILATGAMPGAKHHYRDASPPILERVAALERVCQSHQIPLKAAALQFALAHPGVTGLVVGARSAAEVLDNIRALHMDIPAGLWRDLRREGLIGKMAPTP